MLDLHIGVVNVCLELLTELFKSKNHEFCNALVGHTKKDSELKTLTILLQKICSKFLYSQFNGSFKADVQVSVQSNVINFLNSYPDSYISDIVCDPLLMKIVLEMCKHPDFLIREKSISFISKFMNKNVLHSEQKTQLLKTLILVRLELFIIF